MARGRIPNRPAVAGLVDLRAVSGNLRLGGREGSKRKRRVSGLGFAGFAGGADGHGHRRGPLPIVPPAQWGGLLLSLLATLATLAISLPLGLALALGRRSELPVVRWLCAGLIESLRSVPLLGLLFVAATVLPMFLPSHWDVDLFARAMAAFALFNAAMAAEVFRGGLQAVGAGQYEAATTVGLSRWATLRLIVLPQAVSAVVPALVNLMVAVIKETTLLSVIGLSDFLGAVENGAKTPDWMGDPNILTSGHVFLAAVYLAFCWSLSRHSRRLETLP